MAEIKMRPAVYANHKRKDGSYPVKIVIYYKGKERKLPTHIVAQKKDLTRTLHLKPGEALNAAQDLIIKMQTACMSIPYFDLEYQDVDFVVNYIKGRLAKEAFNLDFFKFAQDYIADKKASTRAQYEQALSAFARFIKAGEIDINAITRAKVVEFIDFLNNEPKMFHNVATGKAEPTNKKKARGGQAARHIMKLASIYRAAKKKYNDEDSERVMIPRSPFEGHGLAAPQVQGQKSLPEEIMQRLISAHPVNEHVRRCIDVAVVSFGLMGMNLADLYETESPKGSVLVYNRKKTRDRRADCAEMRIDIPECILPYVERLQSARVKGVWLGKLHEMASASQITPVVNSGLAKWCEDEGVERFTFYAIRKAWATIARGKAGVEKSLVDEGLAHVGDFRMTDIYAERPWEKINEANSKVLALFRWE